VIAGRCAVVEPELAAVEPDHMVSCHLYPVLEHDDVIPGTELVR
jgi:hypothetical protein